MKPEEKPDAIKDKATKRDATTVQRKEHDKDNP
jgi:hypothetical protein